MIVLAIDTAGVDCAAAVYDSSTGTVLSQVSETIGRGHAERLMAMIDEALEKAGLDLNAVERIGVTVGPGSFTGIRVGVAAARGLALALGVDCVGVNTLEVLARSVTAPGQTILAGINAHREEIYLQAFKDQMPCEAPALTTIQDYLSRARDAGSVAVGSAAELIDNPEAVTAPDHFPIETVALLAAEATGQGKAKPLYLRGPDAKPQTGFAVARA